MAEDISRQLLDARLRYSTALMQQGRVLTDSCWNEMVNLEAEDRRQAIQETVCAGGSPNEGFRVLPPAAPAAVNTFPAPGPGAVAVNSYSLALAPGSFYLGGHRFALDPDAPESTLSQNDWLTMTLGAGKVPPIPVAARTDIVYLRGWEQAVTSFEDQEFRERALGGPDTSVRVRRMRRVEVLTGAAAATCAEAEDELHAFLAQPAAGDVTGVPHDFDATGTELLSKARLTVDFVGNAGNGDPCNPALQPGFIGAENQAIRVQLTAANSFVWGIDNAAPIYRVQIDPADATRRTIHFVTTPRDRAAMPLVNQAVEILPWDALLANGEKVAAPSGFVTTVSTTYDPDTQNVVLTAGVPANMAAWLASLPAAVDNPLDPPLERRFFYLRVWSGGAPQLFTPLSVNPAVAPIPLPGTGLGLTFSDFGLPGDYWVIAARPNTPDRLVPWRLRDDAPPNGPRQFFAVLALVRWTVVGGVPTAQVQDCRERFRPLCRINGCCTVTVGDGQESHGDFETIRDALDALPPEGGEVCVLPGRYEEAVVVGGHDITIHGCGPRTEIVAPAGAPAAITIDFAQRITIRDLRVTAPAAVGVAAINRCTDVVLRKLTIAARDRAAIIAKGQRITVEECDAAAEPLAADIDPALPLGLEPLVYVAGTRLRVERNELTAAEDDGAERTALGGLQIGGGSTDVEVRRNRIRGGNGNGITLGSVAFVRAGDADDFADSGDDGGIVISVAVFIFDEDGCIGVIGDPDDPGNGGEPGDVPVSQGDLEDVRIIENRIGGMGQSGIAVARLSFPGNAPDLITVRRLLVRGNEIRDCMELEAGPITVQSAPRVAFGGIVLADSTLVSIHDNVIEDVGVAHRDPVCGVFVLLAEGIDIRRNRIRRVGRIADEGATLKLGTRGGIVIHTAIPPTEATGGVRRLSGHRQDGTPAVVVHENVVVAREGRALFVRGIGAMAITDNQLTAHGSGSFALLGLLLAAVRGGFVADSPIGLASGAQANAATASLIIDAIAANAVLVLNFGLSNELYFQLLGLNGGVLSDLGLPGEGSDWFVGGGVQFSDNQVVFDALNPTATFSLCATLILSFDQVTMADNQLECDLANDFVIVNAVAVAWAVAATGNRFTEGVFNALLSALTVGLLNATALNVATHCVIHLGAIEPSADATVTGGGAPQPTVDVELRLNPTLVDPTGAGRCFGLGRGTDRAVTGWPLPMRTVGLMAVDV